MPNPHPVVAAPSREEDLVRRARAGDGAAFRAIMTQSNQRLFRTARSIMRDDAEAEDVLQEAYMRAFRALGDFRAQSSITTWLTRIVINEARGRLRRRRTMVGIEQIELADRASAEIIAFPTAAETPERAIETAHIRKLLEEAIDALPEPFRLVFIMRELNQCSVEETAASLDLNPATVKTRLHRARAAMRRMLDARLKATLADAFSFLGNACERVTATVERRLAAERRILAASQVD
jgi:RNA polymerase sigma-70 factor (ECF subfamily)